MKNNKGGQFNGHGMKRKTADKNLDNTPHSKI